MAGEAASVGKACGFHFKISKSRAACFQLLRNASWGLTAAGQLHRAQIPVICGHTAGFLGPEGGLVAVGKGGCRGTDQKWSQGPVEDGQAAGDTAEQPWGPGPAYRRLTLGSSSPPPGAQEASGAHGLGLQAGLESLSRAPGGCMSTGWGPWGTP